MIAVLVTRCGCSRTIELDQQFVIRREPVKVPISTSMLVPVQGVVDVTLFKCRVFEYDGRMTHDIALYRESGEV